MSFNPPAGYGGQPGFPAPNNGYPGQMHGQPSGPGYQAGYPAVSPPMQPPMHAVQQVHTPVSSGAAAIDTAVDCDGAQFRIAHRDSNSLLSCRLPAGYEIKAHPGSMVAMDASVKIRGKLKISFKKLITNSELAESYITGPGEVLLAPETWGDVVPIRLDGTTTWNFSKHSFLACTQGVTRAHKAQSFGKALFSGEGLFVEQASGTGVIFVQSIGAIVQRSLNPGEQWIVDNGHLVAWTAKYSVEKIKAGGLISGLKTEEGLVCRFTGPGTVYIQTRNPDVLIEWIHEQLPTE